MNIKILSLMAVWCCCFFGVMGWRPDFTYNAQRYFEWFLMGSLLVLGLTLPVKMQLTRKFSILFLLLCLCMVWVAFAAANGWLALRYFITYIALFLAALAIAKARIAAEREVFDRAALTGLVVLCLGASLIVLNGLLLSLLIGQVNRLVIFDAFVNVRFLSELQFATLLMLPAAWLLTCSTWQKNLISITASCWWCWLLFSGTRAGLVVLPFAVLLVVLCAGKSSFIWLKRLATQVAGGLLLFVSLRLLLATFYSSHISADMKFERSGEISNGRFDLWQQAWNHFIAAPWLGNGPGAFACLTWRDEASPHNLLLMLLSEWGVMVSLLVATIALWVFVVMLRRLRSNLKGDPLALSLFASVVAIVGATQLQGMLIAPLGQMATVLIFGWAWGFFATKNFATLQSKAGSLSGLRIMHVTVTVALLALWVVMARYDLPLQKQLMTLPDGTVVLSYGPRYWADGHDHCPLWHQRKLSERTAGG